jgi:RNA polymerase sigma factor (sigma-70 family)
MAAVPSGERTEQLFESYSRQLYSFCLYRLGDRHEAEDAVQSTFLNAFRGLERGVVPYSDAAWLFKIAQNVCLTLKRSSFRRRRIESPVPIDDSVASPEYETDAVFDLAGAVRGLPAKQRRAILLREWRGLSYDEIASDLGLTQSAVETLLHRARRSLRAAA